ncbi:MAG: carboxypeptidase-like regulatory domain-containing protein [Candidatus Diapherotrites archaeon]|nr:carboxypeptidase-like regulatory domain-containing protein [Candidatus Diapherotrites archaeon]
MNKNFAVIILLSAVFLLAGCASIGTKEYSINFNVSDAFGNPVNNASISIMPSNENQLTNVISTDSNGTASIVLMSGNYSVTVSKPGFNSYFRVLGFSKNEKVTVVLEETLQ